MCIALFTTAHPDYPFILINNRDEYLTRPTAHADFWPTPNTHVLGGRDLQRAVQGTWLGITRQGRITVLTNFREEGVEISGVKSRGALPKAFLTLPEASSLTSEGFAKRLVEEIGVGDVGGFSLAFGRLRRRGLCPESKVVDGHERPGIAIVSNRTAHVGATTWICTEPGETQGLSNSHFGDRSWPKVVNGENELRRVVESHSEAKTGKEDLIAQLFEILSLDTLPQQKRGENWETYLYQLRNSIFIPRICDGSEGIRADEIAAADQAKPASADGGGGLYGTQKQTVILVNRNGKVTFVEKTLYDGQGRPLRDDKRAYEFDVEGWDD